MSNEIRTISISEIQDHPEEANIYGKPELDTEFIASIKDVGVLQPVILCDIKLLPKENRGKGYKYFLVSGHRRKYGSIESGLTEIPAQIREYSSYDETVLHLLVTNQNREKTEGQRIREYLQAKQTLCQLGKVKQGKGTYENTSFENDEFLRFLNSYKIKEDQPLNSIEILSEITGFSEWKQRVMNTIYDDAFMEKKLKALRKMGAPTKAEDDILRHWLDIREKADKKEIELSDAYNYITDLIKSFEKKLNPAKKWKKESKQAKGKKQKEQIVETKTMGDDSLVLTQLIGIKETWSQTPMEQDLSKAVLDFVLKTENGDDIAIIKTMGSVTGLAVKPRGSQIVYEVNTEYLGDYMFDYAVNKD